MRVRSSLVALLALTSCAEPAADPRTAEIVATPTFAFTASHAPGHSSTCCGATASSYYQATTPPAHAAAEATCGSTWSPPLVVTTTFTRPGSTVAASGVGMASSQAIFGVGTTACTTASKNGFQAAAPSHTFARTPPVDCTSSVYVGPDDGGRDPSA